jgi:hypothetical protein
MLCREVLAATAREGPLPGIVAALSPTGFYMLSSYALPEQYIPFLDVVQDDESLRLAIRDAINSSLAARQAAATDSPPA